MDKRTKLYLKRKAALTSISADCTLKDLLKAEFYAAKSIVVKKDVLKTYSIITKMQTETAIAE